MSAQEAFCTMSDLPREEPQEERSTLKLVRLKRQTKEHFVYLPARVDAHDVHFIVDTGSCLSVVSKSAVSPKQIKSCDLKEIRYLGVAFMIIGRAPVSLSLSNGRSSLEIVYTVYVSEGLQDSLLAMDFLPDFQCVLDRDGEETLTMSRTPCEPLTEYPMPSLDLRLSAAGGRAFRRSTVVDTGAVSTLDLKKAKEKKLQLSKPTGLCGRQFH